MDDPNITMEEYIQLMVDKARGGDQTFNWETATHSKEYCDDLDSFIDFETNFPAIVYNDASTSNQNISYEPTVSIYNAIKADIEFHISFSDSEDEDYTFIYNKGPSFFKLIPINDLNPKPVNEHVEINIESCLENIDIKPMDSVICTSNDTTPIEFVKNIETNHDTPDYYSEDQYAVSIKKIRRIRACTHQRPQKIKDQYAVSRGLNTPYSRYGINIIF
ncbi:hypothetical protein Tco_1026863 [Tanacetum coccineum]